MSHQKIIVQGICYDEKSSYQKGPAKAPSLIRERLWSDAYNHYAENGVEVAPVVIDDRGDMTPSAYWDIYEHTKKVIGSADRLFSLGGDHSVTYPIIKAFAEQQEQDFDILHIDAHGDLYDDYEGDKHSHACPFARIMEDRLTKRLVQVGIRTLNPHQREQVLKYNVQCIEMRDFDLSRLPAFSKPLYISLDMDAFDPAYAPGVSHQESGGLTPREVLALIRSLQVPVIGADIVEYNPDNDLGGITSALAAKMMKEILSIMCSS